MHDIERILLQDGPEDGRILSMDALRSLISDPVDRPEEICLYMESESPESRFVPVLIGRYQLREVRGKQASYRWQTA
ncbi:hypothetical protein OKA04_15060 [Luteolibacter flavescens]|uniref:DUF2249 domain-containing protein n=1 Tax=Luteolibacter flavescens TaxID=1859460 RepID=A0ABT3FS46_9BACT|nr:hypothetical protein [Luteolibacter flavescens]MCW1886056.1 hypothetical protein [Luteolibacter flavescens]